MFMRGRWKPLTTLFTVPGLGIVATCLVISQAHERKEFVGQVDPVSGYRCRFTVASDYQHREGVLQKDALQNTSIFTSIPPNPIRYYLQTEWLHLSPPATPGIYLEQFSEKHPCLVPISNGYPAPVMDIHDRMQSVRHFQIDKDCPVTVITYVGSGQDRSVRYREMYVSLPSGRIGYAVSGRISEGDPFALDHESASKGNAAALDREMDAIISSFHIEKAAAPTGGKR